MVHMVAEKIIISPSYQVPFYGKEGPDKNMLRLGRGVHNLAYPPADREVQGNLPTSH